MGAGQTMKVKRSFPMNGKRICQKFPEMLWGEIPMKDIRKTSYEVYIS
jgi:hypothetical protein